MKNRWWSYYIDMAAFLVGYFTLASLALAADFYTVTASQTVDITEHSTCRRVTNSTAQSIFVPTKTLAEWSSFYNNTPTNVSAGLCATPGITVSAITGNTNESGTTATFTIVLDSLPTANVSIGLSSNDTGEGTVSPATVTFTTANWSTPQTVTVTGVNDALQDGDQSFQIVTAAATSTDGDYNGLNPPNVALLNTDDDTVGITISPTTQLTVSESGTTADYTAVLTSQPSNNVTMGITSSDTGEATVSPSSITFTTANWSTPQTITVTGVDDLIEDGAQVSNIVNAALSSSDTNYNGINPPDLTVATTDDDVYELTLNPVAGLAVDESGTTDTFTAVLSAAPTSNVTFAVSSSDTGEITVDTSSLVFTTANWNSAQTVTITGIDDGTTQDGTQSVNIVIGAASSSDGNYSGHDPDDIYAVNYDDDTYGVLVTPVTSTSNRLLTSEDLDQATYTVRLASQPTANVTVPMSSSDTSEGTVSPASLTFTSVNWNVPQTVTVTGVEEGGSKDGPIDYQINLNGTTSTDTNYNGIDPSDVYLKNLDNDDRAVLLVSPASNSSTNPLVLSEEGSTTSFSMVLGADPGTKTVTVTYTSGDTTEGTVAPSVLTFTPDNWNSPQSVTITSVNDGTQDDNQDFTITGTASASGPYNGAPVDTVSVRNYDDESYNYIIYPTAENATEALVTEAGGQINFTIRLSRAPTADVTLTASSSDTSEGVLSKTSFTFTTTNWNAPQSFVVTGVDDVTTDGDVSFSINFANATSSDGNWSGTKPSDLNITNVDND